MTDQDFPATEAVPATATGNDAPAVTRLAPGFRFHPSDEELISYYLKRKVQSKPIRFDAIGEVDVYKINPSDLPERSRVKTKDQQWFFFTTVEKKYSNSTNKALKRATSEGHWKKTGVDKKIRGGDGQLIGIMKSLVYHIGRAPDYQRTDWMIHEYSLAQNQQGLQDHIDAYVLCKVFVKEQAGISGIIYEPFSEKEWEDDDDNGGARPLTTSSTNLISDLKEKKQMSVERETYELDMTEAEVTISFLQGQIDKLHAENEELKKKNNSNKGQ